MDLTDKQKRIIRQVINVFETGQVEGDYGAISIYPDGPGNMYQITYGSHQTTETGNLGKLIAMYVKANGKFSRQFKPYVDLIGETSLVDDDDFLALLEDAGEDPVMQKCQDDFFEETYFKTAMAWADKNGFTLPLSALVIYDSYIHSGSIRNDIRAKFAEVPPARGGSEMNWITEYVKARHNWLANHSRVILHKTVYRTQCFKGEIARNNWKLSQLPIDANGTDVYGN